MSLMHTVAIDLCRMHTVHYPIPVMLSSGPGLETCGVGLEICGLDLASSGLVTRTFCICGCAACELCDIDTSDRFDLDCVVEGKDIRECDVCGENCWMVIFVCFCNKSFIMFHIATLMYGLGLETCVLGKRSCLHHWLHHELTSWSVLWAMCTVHVMTDVISATMNMVQVHSIMWFIHSKDTELAVKHAIAFHHKNL